MSTSLLKMSGYLRDNMSEKTIDLRPFTYLILIALFYSVTIRTLVIT